MTAVDKLRLKESALQARNRAIKEELRDLDELALTPGGKGGWYWRPYRERFESELLANTRKLATVRRSIGKLVSDTFEEFQHEYASTIGCHCSLAGADPPWMWSWSQMRPFSEMADTGSPVVRAWRAR